MRVAAAITTFNRLQSLKHCVETVRAQTRPLDEIIVVNDASTDGTAAWLAEQTGLTVVNTPENRGCSNSFDTGMRTAHERGHDWVYVMDDDVYSTPDAVERLLEAASDLRNKGVRIGGLHTYQAHWGQDGPKPVPYFFPKTAGQAWRYLHAGCRATAEMGRGAPIEIDWYSFCGTLVSREALETAGFVDTDFFYWNEDADMACRQRARGFHHFLVPQAVVLHKDSRIAQQYAQPPKIGWRQYYLHRNRWRFIRMHGDQLGERMKLVCELRLIERMMRQALGATRRFDFVGTRLVLRGFLDGVLGRMGKRVSPG